MRALRKGDGSSPGQSRCRGPGAGRKVQPGGERGLGPRPAVFSVRRIPGVPRLRRGLSPAAQDEGGSRTQGWRGGSRGGLGEVFAVFWRSGAPSGSVSNFPEVSRDGPQGEGSSINRPGAGGGRRAGSAAARQRLRPEQPSPPGPPQPTQSTPASQPCAPSSSSAPGTAEKLSPKATTLAERSANLAFSLYQAMAKDQAVENILLSPVVVASSLGLV
uniref:Serpin domain-containing protein n=1 Tax=Oryctolagus cuniculus TaxID=9986 RepID=A0A5F9CCT9_RABIT